MLAKYWTMGGQAGRDPLGKRGWVHSASLPKSLLLQRSPHCNTRHPRAHLKLEGRDCPAAAADGQRHVAGQRAVLLVRRRHKAHRLAAHVGAIHKHLAASRGEAHAHLAIPAVRNGGSKRLAALPQQHRLGQYGSLPQRAAAHLKRRPEMVTSVPPATGPIAGEMPRQA